MHLNSQIVGVAIIVMATWLYDAYQKVQDLEKKVKQLQNELYSQNLEYYLKRLNQLGYDYSISKSIGTTGTSSNEQANSKNSSK